MRFSADVSKNMAYKILAMKDDILSVSIIDTKGNILATASKDVLRKILESLQRAIAMVEALR